MQFPRSVRRLTPRTVLATVTAAGLALACSAGPPADGPADATEPVTYSIEQFLGTTNLQGSSFSPDHKRLLVSSDASGVLNAYSVEVEGGAMKSLTASEDSVHVVSYFPDDERFLYLSDQGGNELDHLYVRELDGTVVDLTPGDKLKAAFGGWAEDEATFFVLTNQRDPRYFDVHEVTVDGYASTLFYQDDAGLNFGGVSPNKRYISFDKPKTRADSDVVLHDLQSHENRLLTQHAEGVEIANAFEAFSPDGGTVYYTTDEGSEFQYLVRQDLASGERSEVLRTDWDVAFADFSRDGRYLVVGINHDARTELRLFHGPDLTPVALPQLDGLDITNVDFADGGELMSFYASSSRRPRDLYVHGLEGGVDGGEPLRLTESLNPEIDADELVDAEVVRFASYDGVEIPGLLLKPKGASPQNKVPALVWVHGGPGGQSRIGYHPLQQYLINHGYAVYAINNRGSSGYGKAFFEMDDRKHGDADLKDCIASKQMLIDTGWVDAEKIGIIGGSYGGYMVVAALAFEPEAFQVGVDIFGVTNWLRTLRSIPPWWEAARVSLYKEMGDPNKDEDYLRKISPLFHADGITKPLMVLQGANDPRVLKSESDDIIAKVQENGVPHEYLVFEDEGHGFLKKANQERGYRAILAFLDHHLAKKTPAETQTPKEKEAA